jgi:hypothetical protein
LSTEFRAQLVSHAVGLGVGAVQYTRLRIEIFKATNLCCGKRSHKRTAVYTERISTAANLAGISSTRHVALSRIGWTETQAVATVALGTELQSIVCKIGAEACTFCDGHVWSREARTVERAKVDLVGVASNAIDRRDTLDCQGVRPTAIL